MLTDKILIENGYKQFEDDLYNADCLFQKRVKNNKGQTKYFIEIYKYIIECREISYEVILCCEALNYNLNILLYDIKNEITLEEVEKEIDAIWFGLDCKYYSSED